MRLTTTAMILTVTIMTAGAGPCLAGSYYLQAHGGFSFYNMDDVNVSVDRINEAVGSEVMEHIASGGEAGLQVGVGLTDELGLGLGYARLWASSGLELGGYLIEYDLPADLFEISLDYLPANGREVRVGVGANMGLIRSSAVQRLAVPALGRVEDEFEGSGFLFAGYAILDAVLSPTWAVFGQGGYRHAIMSRLKVDGETVYNPDSLEDKLRFNYSGPFLRVGVRFLP